MEYAEEWRAPIPLNVPRLLSARPRGKTTRRCKRRAQSSSESLIPPQKKATLRSPSSPFLGAFRVATFNPDRRIGSCLKMPLPLNFSSSDITHAAEAVQRSTLHFREAGGSYREMAHLAWSFTSVLSTIQTSVSEPGSPLVVQRHVSEGKSQLADTIRGCKNVVDEAFALLETYGSSEGVTDDNRLRRVWDRAR
jgi:hypothetical protein